jgi:FKBP-type peptidyl-prolyl cis-trans isomerases 2
VPISTGDDVTFEYIGRLHDDQTVFDTSRRAVAEENGLADAQPDRDFDALSVEVGAGKVIEGMDEGLVGLETGETETLTISPEKGYGEWDEDRVQELDTDELREMLGGETPDEGDQLQAESGQRGEVTSVTDEVVRVDFNPALAGETLEFEVEILEVN